MRQRHLGERGVVEPRGLRAVGVDAAEEPALVEVIAAGRLVGERRLLV
jgi:hypothetical protein